MPLDEHDGERPKYSNWNVPQTADTSKMAKQAVSKEQREPEEETNEITIEAGKVKGQPTMLSSEI